MDKSDQESRTLFPSFRLGEFYIDGSAPPFVIAEIGVNHNGSVETAHELVDAAVETGVQAVKFQIFSSDRVAHKEAPAADYQRELTGVTTQWGLLQSLELPMSAWDELAHHTREVGLAFIATAFDRPSLDLLVSLAPEALKIGSGDLTNRRFLASAASTGLPIIASTGLATAEEVARSSRLLRELSSEFALLHCLTSYPAPMHQVNLRAIPTLKTQERVVVGWSDHTLGSRSAILARVLGAAIFERHFTLDRHQPGPDHKASCDPDELSSYVADLTEVDLMLGDGVKSPAEAEVPLRPLVRRSHYATRDLFAGDVLSESDTELLRPEAGISAFESLVGRVLVRAVRGGSPIKHEHLVR